LIVVAHFCDVESDLVCRGAPRQTINRLVSGTVIATAPESRRGRWRLRMAAGFASARAAPGAERHQCESDDSGPNATTLRRTPGGIGLGG
jgi:hypothetical protein